MIVIMSQIHYTYFTEHFSGLAAGSSRVLCYKPFGIVEAGLLDCRCHLLSTINVICDISIHSDYTQLCSKYSVAGCSKGQCRVSVKRAFINNVEL